MSRRRMIDPNFWISEDVGKLNMLERLLLIGMFSNADDYGKGRANPVYLRSTIFPYDDIPVNEIEAGLNNIAKYINIKFYMVDGSQYYKFIHWNKWQNVQHPQASKIPDPVDKSSEIVPELAKNDSGIILEPIESDSGLKEIEKENKEKENIIQQEGKCEGEPTADAAGECDLTPAEKSSDTADDGAQQKECDKTASVGKGEEYTPEFEEFWFYYPRRIEKKTAFRAWKARLKERVPPEDMIKACMNYASYCQMQHTEPRFIKHPSTFLGPDKPYEEFINGPPEPVQSKASPAEPKGWATLRALYAKYQQEEGRT